MEADRQMATLLVEVALQRGQHADRADGDALGAPGEAPRRRQHLQGARHGVVVVERLAHPHEHGVGELVRLVDAEELIENVGGVQLPVVAVPAGHAELASHPASRLRADTERLAVFFGYHHRLDVGLLLLRSARPRRRDLEEVLFGAVAGHRAADRGAHAQVVALRQRLPPRLGDIDHPVPGPGALGIQPIRELRAHEGLQSAIHRRFLQLLQRLSEQLLFHSLSHLLIHLRKITKISAHILLRPPPAADGSTGRPASKRDRRAHKCVARGPICRKMGRLGVQ